MKKRIFLLLCLLCSFFMYGCKEKAKSPDTTRTETPNSTIQDLTTQSPDLLEAGLGDLKIYYDASWSFDESQSQDASLAFTKGEALIGITCSKETSYQHPLDMIRASQDIISTSEGYELLEESKKITVNNETWYECTYTFGTGEDKNTVIQRCYGKNYYAYSITYTALDSNYEDLKEEALKIMDSAIMAVPDNALAEEEAKKSLVGEYDAGTGGYVVLNADGTYYWYKDSSKDMNYVHYGTYGCDIQIASLNIAEGSGFYVCLFPEKYIIDGQENEMGSPKYDYGFSPKTDSPDDFEVLNITNLSSYIFKRVK
ncbi:hypothetical protein [Anaeromicropila populeti]|uniref:Uncharacterized protein n=1 Tax=Anaeromicropila populeti TaxID=37658 RepID=A0A1I6JM73_9FIRM|nr:hypothetical protein [Anaeromicropila populeti]SFR80065.1 hypothetical protein SAMN05661086_01754 [Anaeromicropila populeti]